MPSLTRSFSGPPELSSTAKKRRRDDDAVDQPTGPHDAFSTRRVSMIWTSDATVDHQAVGHLNSHESFAASNVSANERAVFHQASPNRGAPTALFGIQRKIIPLPVSKRARVCSEYGAHTHPEALKSSAFHQPASPQRPAPTKIPAALLSPCHICHRKPTKKTDLNSYANCMGCDERTCYICIRECAGWLVPGGGNDDLSTSFTMHDVDYERDPNAGSAQGWNGSDHQPMICSRCCVERGFEGDVICLGCLARVDAA